MRELDVLDAAVEHAEVIADLIHRSFGARRRLEPQSTALAETAESVGRALAGPGGLLVERRGRPMGALLFDDSRPDRLGLRRVCVDPDGQSRGVASAMVGVAEDTALERGLAGLWLLVREELPETVQFWSRRRYWPVRQEGPFIEFAKALPFSREVVDPRAMAEFAAAVAQLCMPGDLLVLSGELGAGKTTFTQGFAEALGVRGPVTSPTFVLARSHVSNVGGPALVHVDAYRLGGAAELDDLDLDTAADESVTVVEWGSGLAEQLSDSWLEISIEVVESDALDSRASASSMPSEEDPVQPRLVTLRSRGPRWAGVALRSILAG